MFIILKTIKIVYKYKLDIHCPQEDVTICEHDYSYYSFKTSSSIKYN